MPKGQSPRENAYAKLNLLDEQLKKANDIGAVRKIQTLFHARVGLFKSNRTPDERKKIASLKAKIDKRSASLLKNAKSGGEL